MEDFPHSDQPTSPAESTPSAEPTANEPMLSHRRAPEPDDPARPGWRERLEQAQQRIPKPAAREPRPVKPNLPRQASRWLRRVVTLALVSVAIVLVAVIALSLHLRHAMRDALPVLDGTEHLAGLHAAVDVVRDTHGVPSITADSTDDLLFAQGYITASDRLFQMDMLRRHAAGELAELLGASLVDHDKQQRILRLRDAADAAMATMPADHRAELEAYTRGVNAYIETHRKHLPVEFTFLHYEPAPWQPRDSLLVLLAMWQSLSTSFPHKLAHESLMTHLPADLESDLYPTSSFRDHPPAQPSTDLAAPVDEIEQIPLDSTQSSLQPDQLRDRMHTLGLEACAECRAGSNNWAVAASRSASGAPLLSNDMHLGLSVPDIWYEATLHLRSNTAPMDVTGFTLPGYPYVLVGRNAHVAWSFTNLGGDVQDVYIEHTRGTGRSLEYQRPDGTWIPAQHQSETIRVRFHRDVTIDVVTTSHALGAKTLQTPVITSLFPGDKRTLSLAWTIYDPAALVIPLRSFNTARDGATLAAEAATIGGPSLNLVYADDSGHIGYHALGFIPVRGPAEHHPRALPQLILPTDEQPEENDDQDPSPGASSEPQAQLAAPHLILAAYMPPQRGRRRHRAALPPKPAPAEEKPRVATEPETSTTIIAPLPAVVDYTIGSPIRDVPVDALDASQVWSGYVPYDAMPSVVDPASGIIATANARVTRESDPYAIANEWAAPFRTERIYQRLEGRTGLTPNDMLAVQTDVHSNFDHFLAERLAYAVDHAGKQVRSHDTKRLLLAADILRRWNGNVTTEAVAPSIVTSLKYTLLHNLLVAQIRKHDHLSANDSKADTLANFYLWANESTALELLLNRQPRRWLPDGYKTWDDFLTAMLASALKGSDAPGDLTRWTWGSQHTSADIHHPLFTPSSHLSRLLGAHANPPKTPLPGDGSTVDAIAGSHGPSERFTADLSGPDRSWANLPTGESGNPASPNYLDHFDAWSKGTTFPLSLHPLAAHTLTLEP